jgi:hypothetical protein
MISTSIYTEIQSTIASVISSFKGTFKPTYLIIRQHRLTGKLYFHKTVRNPKKYLGSGPKWVNHINKHGREHIETLSCILFTELEECARYAITVSLSLDIVGSDEWANDIIETGLGGGSYGRKNSEETIEKNERESKEQTTTHNRT